MSLLAKRLRAAREAAGLTLDEVATRAGISKTYYWELENDEEGKIKPSADVLMKIANALSTTMAHLLGMPTVQVSQEAVEIPPSLVKFIEERKKIDKPLSQQDIRELASMRFRGGQPTTAEGWNDVYSALDRNIKKRKK